jgi:hypothetical protein
MLAGVFAADVCVFADVGCFFTAVRCVCANDGGVAAHDVEVESVDDCSLPSVVCASTPNAGELADVVSEPAAVRK